MSLENEFGIDPEKEAAIVDFLKDADRQIGENPEGFLQRTAKYLEVFGPVNFAALEQLFRKHNFNAHQLAVRAPLVEQEHPGYMVADVNAAVFNRLLVPVPYAVVTCRSMDHLQEKARQYHVSYNPVRNLERLKSAGDLFRKPQSPQRVFVAGQLPN